MSCLLGRTFNPQTLTDLGAYYVSVGGVNDGITGGRTHVGGYHLGKGRLFATGPTYWAGVSSDTLHCVAGKGWNDYSAVNARDKAGLSDAAAAIDLGLIDGSHAKLQQLTAYLLGACRANDPKAGDIREIIGSLDGSTMFEWLRERDGKDAGQPYSRDPSHLDHTHLSYYRDSQARDKRPLFAAYFAGVTTGGTAGGSDLPGLRIKIPDPTGVGDVTMPKGTPALRVSDGASLSGGVGIDATRLGYGALIVNPDGSTHAVGYLVNLTTFGLVEAWFVLVADVTFTPVPTTTVIGHTDAELAAASLSGREYEWDRQFSGTSGAKVTPLARP